MVGRSLVPQSYAGQTASHDVDLKLMAIFLDSEAGVELLKKVKSELRSYEAFSELDRTPKTIENGRNGGKCTLECKFKNVECELSFAHEDTHSHRKHEFLRVILRRMIGNSSPHDRV